MAHCLGVWLALTVVLHQTLGVLPRVYADGAELLVVDGGWLALAGVAGRRSRPPTRLHVVHGVGKVSVVCLPGFTSSSLLEGRTLELHIGSLSE